jgi:hypothetical protein
MFRILSLLRDLMMASRSMNHPMKWWVEDDNVLRVEIQLNQDSMKYVRDMQRLVEPSLTEEEMDVVGP